MVFNSCVRCVKKVVLSDDIGLFWCADGEVMGVTREREGGGSGKGGEKGGSPIDRQSAPIMTQQLETDNQSANFSKSSWEGWKRGGN